MGTRATYEIDGQVFYCHWDGYREGAARRFANMIEAMTVPEEGDRKAIDAIAERRGEAAFAFIRGNLDAEPAFRNRHDGHGDTEFRYRVTISAANGLDVQVEARRAGDWMGFGAPQSLAAFVNTYGPKAGAPRICAMLDPSPYHRRIILATVAHARRIAERHRELAARFDDDNPNKQGHLDHAEAWERALAEADQGAAIVAA